MTETLIRDVSDTAFMVAAYRDIETNRPNPLFRDPLAARLTGDRGHKIAAVRPQAAVVAWTVALRTVIIDDFIQAALAQGVDRVLNLGAGLDTRPYRMDLPGSLRWVEVDFPHMVEWKENRLSSERPRCGLERVKLDLGDLPARQELFARINAQSRKVLVLTEGVVPYLSLEEAAQLAGDLNNMDKARFWVVDYISPSTLRSRRRIGANRHIKNAPFKFEPKDWSGFFLGKGWRVKEMRYFADEGERLKRPIPLSWFRKAGFILRALFMSPGKRAEMRKYAGYALLEPTEP